MLSSIFAAVAREVEAFKAVTDPGHATPKVAHPETSIKRALSSCLALSCLNRLQLRAPVQSPPSLHAMHDLSARRVPLCFHRERLLRVNPGSGHPNL